MRTLVVSQLVKLIDDYSEPCCMVYKNALRGTSLESQRLTYHYKEMVTKYWQMSRLQMLQEWSAQRPEQSEFWRLKSNFQRWRGTEHESSRAYSKNLEARKQVTGDWMDFGREFHREKKKLTTWLLKCKVRPWALKRVKRKPSLSVNANRQVGIQTSSEPAAGHRQPRSCLSFVSFPSTTFLAPAGERSLLGRVYVISMVWLTQVNLISSTTILIAWTKFFLPYDITEWAETYTVPSKTPTSQSL